MQTTSLRSYYWVLLLAAFGAIVFAFARPMNQFFSDLWMHEEYQYFPFVFVAIAVIFAADWQSGRDVPVQNSRIWAAAILLALATLAMAGSMALHTTRLVAISLMLTVTAGAAIASRHRSLSRFWRTFLLWGLTIPLPLGIDARLIRWMRLLSSKLSSALLDSLGILHLTEGNIVQLPERQLFVDDACSGIVSALSILAVALIYCVWMGRSLLHLCALLVAAIFWAILLNTIRITLIAYALQSWALDLTSGTSHEMLSLVIFLIAFLLVLSSDWALFTLLAPIREDMIGGSTRLTRAWNRAIQWLAVPPLEFPDLRRLAASIRPRPSATSGLAFAIALIAIFVPMGWASSYYESYARPAIDEDFAEQIYANVLQLPREIGDWRVEFAERVERDADDLFGRFSHAYVATNPNLGLSATLSFDFPYVSGWHDLDYCYTSAGWLRRERLPCAAPRKWNMMTARYERGDEHSYLVYSEFDSAGAPISPPTGKLRELFWRNHRQTEPTFKRLLFQVQVWAMTDVVVNDSMRSSMQELLIVSRELFRTHVELLATEGK